MSSKDTKTPTIVISGKRYFDYGCVPQPGISVHKKKELRLAKKAGRSSFYRSKSESYVELSPELIPM